MVYHDHINDMTLVRVSLTTSETNVATRFSMSVRSLPLGFLDFRDFDLLRNGGDCLANFDFGFRDFDFLRKVDFAFRDDFDFLRKDVGRFFRVFCFAKIFVCLIFYL